MVHYNHCQTTVNISLEKFSALNPPRDQDDERRFYRQALCFGRSLSFGPSVVTDLAFFPTGLSENDGRPFKAGNLKS